MIIQISRGKTKDWKAELWLWRLACRPNIHQHAVEKLTEHSCFRQQITPRQQIRNLSREFRRVSDFEALLKYWAVDRNIDLLIKRRGESLDHNIILVRGISKASWNSMNCWRCRDPGDARENIHQRPRPFQIQPKLSLSKTYNQLIMRQIVRCHIAWTFALLILLVLKWYIISLNLRQKNIELSS